MRKKIRYVLIIIFIFAAFLAISARILNGKKNLNFFEKSIKDTAMFVEKIAYSPIKFIKDKIEMLTESNKLYKKYKKLQDKVDKTDLYYAEIQELKKEVDELKETLDLNATLSEYKYVNATVINRNMGQWYNTMTIDKGTKNGINVGDAVITSKGLIGRINSASNFSSTVKLLTTDEIINKISIKIENEDKYYYGLLQGYNSEKNIYIVEGVEESGKIKEGNIVTTTGLTDYFPSGILIGKVNRVVMDEYDLNSIIEITPSVDFNNFSVVTVLNREASK